MNLRKKHITVLIWIAVVMLYGCSSSSSSRRYYSKNKEKKDTVSVTRFSDYSTNLTDTLEYDFDELEYDEDDEADSAFTEDDVVLVDQLLKKFYELEGISEDANTINPQEKVIMEIIKYLDTPYRYGGTSESGIDCSAFTRTIYENTCALILPRTARDQFQLGDVIERKEDLKFGDLVFFNTRRRVRPGHVGIYIGDNLFAHASLKKGVTVSTLEDGYYLRKFMGGRRLENLPFLAN